MHLVVILAGVHRPLGLADGHPEHPQRGDDGQVVRQAQHDEGQDEVDGYTMNQYITYVLAELAVQAGVQREHQTLDYVGELGGGVGPDPHPEGWEWVAV
jgi:hypothetical protein